MKFNFGPANVTLVIPLIFAGPVEGDTMVITNLWAENFENEFQHLSVADEAFEIIVILSGKSIRFVTFDRF